MVAAASLPPYCPPVLHKSIERRETPPPINGNHPVAWGQDLHWIEVELLQFGEALHYCRHTQQQGKQRLTIAWRGTTIAIEQDVGTELRHHCSGINVAYRGETKRHVAHHLDQCATKSAD